ncbi:BQ5605_C060g12722 [Microbotryum silenes-dioicae]|uniref:BQ5605_C060g12722 protein n=1 Tax=Microbotryum silenes-dioicae TaxID=796604 RepID=A0A2X0PQQ9_9BASI|nr:BQ5605_C060g12722 [Microbotryum silenes-dioicae]
MQARAADRPEGISSRASGSVRSGHFQHGIINGTGGSTLAHPPLEWVACLGCLKSHPVLLPFTEPWDNLYITTCCHVLCARCAFSGHASEIATATASAHHQPAPSDPPSTATLETLSLSCAICSLDTQFMLLDENVPDELAPCFRPLVRTLEELSAATNWQVDHLALQVAWLRHKCERQKGNLTKLVQELKRIKGELGKFRELEQENERLRALVDSREPRHEHEFRLPHRPMGLHPPSDPRYDHLTLHEAQPDHAITRREAPDNPARPSSVAALPAAPSRYSLPGTLKKQSHEWPGPRSRTSSIAARSPPQRSASVSTKSPRQRPYPRPQASPHQTLATRPASAQPTARMSPWRHPAATPPPPRASTAQGNRQHFEPLHAAQYRARQEQAGLGKIDEENTGLRATEPQWERFRPPPSPFSGTRSGSVILPHIETGTVRVSTPRQPFVPCPASASRRTGYEDTRGQSLPRGFQTARDLHRFG